MDEADLVMKKDFFVYLCPLILFGGDAYCFLHVFCKPIANHQNFTTMKNVLLVAFFFSFFSIQSFTQSFELYHNGELFPSGGTITVIGEAQPQLWLYAHMSIKNISETDKYVKARKHEIDVVTGSDNTFCWVICWLNTIFTSPSGLTLEPGELNETFTGDYISNGNSGVTIMRYSFFDDDNPMDSVYFYAEFNAGTVGIDEMGIESVVVSHAYPNPARSQVSFDYTIPATASQATIRVHNLLGSVVKEIRLTEPTGKVTVDVNDLKDGFYFYSITANNEIIDTRRLVIAR